MLVRTEVRMEGSWGSGVVLSFVYPIHSREVKDLQGIFMQCHHHINKSLECILHTGLSNQTRVLIHLGQKNPEHLYTAARKKGYRYNN